MSRLLLVEDEESLAEPIARGLREEGYGVDVAGDGINGMRMALVGDYDVLVVDWRLPRLDGRAMIERLRVAEVGTPILMLTAMRDVDQRVAGLDAGADDYLTKPFAFEELLARLRALLRRSGEDRYPPGVQPTSLGVGSLHMDTSRRLLYVAGQSIVLRDKEYRLLELLVRLEGEVATRTRIAEHVWGSAFDVTDNAIDVTISNLRQRLGEVISHSSSPVVIETVRGVGYRLRAEYPGADDAKDTDA